MNEYFEVHETYEPPPRKLEVGKTWRSPLTEEDVRRIVREELERARAEP
jgi:hypothetical protein